MSSNGERLLHGAKHRISSPFGYRIHPITGKPQGHNGVDYATYGSKVPCYSPADGGTVLKTGKDSYGALFVYVRFPELDRVGLYYHLDRIDVRKGQSVDRNTQIGVVGTTGRSTGVHLHFSWILNNSRATQYYQADYEDFEAYVFPAAELEEGDEEMREEYKTIADVPENFRSIVQWMMDAGIVYGKAADNLGLTYDDCRHIVWDYRVLMHREKREG